MKLKLPSTSKSDLVIPQGLLSKLINDPDKPLLPSKAVYQTPEEVAAANAEARRFSKAHNTLYANDAYVAKKPGDPVVQYRTLDGKPYTPQQMPASMVKTSVPDWVTELHMDDNWKMPYYLDGNDMVYVKKDFFNSPRFTKTIPVNEKQAAVLLAKK